MQQYFPLLKKNIIYFDSAATSLKLESVIDSESRYYSELGINTGRGTSLLNYQTTELLESVRDRIAKYIGAKNKDEIVFTSNCTDSINMVANCYVRNKIKTNNNIVITQLEHHSNYVPWVELAKEFNIECRIIPLVNYKIDNSFINDYIDENTIITAITGMSNITGDITDLNPFINRCRLVGSKILLDAAQLITHKPIDLSKTDVDFISFSAHKMFGPFGLGFLYSKYDLLKDFKPNKFGGNMVTYINNLRDIHYWDFPRNLESGTQNPAAIYAFNSVLDFLDDNPVQDSELIITKVSNYLISELKGIEGVTIYSSKGPIISFNIKGIHPHDASDFFDKKGIILRTGNLCASPFFNNLDESGVIRVSLGVYNTTKEIDILINTINDIKEFFK